MVMYAIVILSNRSCLSWTAFCFFASVWVNFEVFVDCFLHTLGTGDRRAEFANSVDVDEVAPFLFGGLWFNR